MVSIPGKFGAFHPHHIRRGSLLISSINLLSIIVPH